MFRKTNLFVLILFQITVYRFCFVEGENYTYIAQVLEKLIRLEVKVKEMEKEMKRTNEDTKSVLKNVNSALENKTEEQDKQRTPMVAFNAYDPVDKSLDTNQILRLNTVRLNKGDGYDNVLGIFTAPVRGLYFFVAHMCNYAGHGLHYDIILEHTTIARSTQFNNAQYDCSSTHAVTIVSKGQRVYVRCTSGNTNQQIYDDSYRQTSFSGFLLQRQLDE